jgi:hypothetical protein
MLARDMFVSDFGESVRVETITTVEQSLPLATVAQRVNPISAAFLWGNSPLGPGPTVNRKERFAVCPRPEARADPRSWW